MCQKTKFLHLFHPHSTCLHITLRKCEFLCETIYTTEAEIAKWKKRVENWFRYEIELHQDGLTRASPCAKVDRIYSACKRFAKQFNTFGEKYTYSFFFLHLKWLIAYLCSMNDCKACEELSLAWRLNEWKKCFMSRSLCAKLHIDIARSDWQQRCGKKIFVWMKTN